MAGGCALHRTPALERRLLMNPPVGAIEHYREMSITHADLFRLLPAAIQNRPYALATRSITVQLEGGTVEIDFSEEEQRNIASLVLPVTHLNFRFCGVAPQAVSLFMERFDRSFQRGGG